MAMAGLYRRVLPSPPAIDFASSEGKLLFMEAIQGGTMEGFFKLISYFQTQSEPAYCGLATLAMVLNALSIDPGRKWKGPWRWFDESMLDCCEPLEKVKAEGISFGKVVCLAHCAGAKVEAFRTNKSNINDFRKHIITCSTADGCHVISSYNRGTLKQTGSGHFSPIGGYHAGRDMVLLLDVARFKYPPHWVPLTLLWEAMDTIDDASGFRRGYPDGRVGQLVLCQNGWFLIHSCKHESWTEIANYLVEDVPTLLSSEDANDVKDVLSIVFSSLPFKFLEFIKWVVEVRHREDGGQSLSVEEKERLAIKEEILKQVQETRLYKHVTDFLCTGNSCAFKESCLVDIADSVCFQGTQLFETSFGSLSTKGFCCRETCIKPNGAGIQQVDIIGMHPAKNDVLTVLLLALPPQTWFGIKNEKLMEDVSTLVSMDNLPTLLQEEIMHIRGQLYILKRCKDDEIEEDLSAPLF